MKISHLLKYIADLNPQNTPARLAFYNFLRHFLFLTDELTPQVFNTFFSFALEYPHWESNKISLGKEVQLLMEGFVRLHKWDFDFSTIDFPQNLQIIDIQSTSDFIAVAHNYAKTVLPQDVKFRIIPDQSRRILLVVLNPDQSVDITVLDKKFTIRNGSLEPLKQNIKLSYNSNLELKENTIHRLEVAPYLMAHFTMDQGRPHGCLLRGYVFQKYQELNQLPLEEQTKVFHPLKKLEQLYIDRQSDPYYLDLIGQISEVTQFFRESEKTLAIEKIAKQALDRAEIANRDVFFGDKTLTELIKDLKQLFSPACATLDLAPQTQGLTTYASNLTSGGTPKGILNYDSKRTNYQTQ